MSSPIFGTPIYSDVGVLYTPTLSGGSWEASLPRTNLQDRRLHRVARSTDAAVASTVFTLNAGADRDVRALALCNHNISEAGRVRVRGFWESGSGTTGLPILDVLDFSTGWTTTGTPTRSAAAFTCDDGVPLDLIGDDDAASIEQYQRTVTYPNNGDRTLVFRVKEGTATSGVISIQDLTAAVTRLRFAITFSAGVPSLTMSVGTLQGTTALGNGVYRFYVRATGIVAANSNQLRVSPATDLAATTSLTGTMYLGDFLAWDSTQDRLRYDTGYQLALPSGTTVEDREGITPTWAHIASANQSAKHWRVNITDTTNAAGYVQIGRLVIAGGFEPEITMAAGAGLGWEDDSRRTVTDGGAALYDVRRKRRTAQGVLDMMPETEAYGAWFALRQRLGTTGQFFYAMDAADTGLMLARRSFLAVFKELDPITHPHLARHRTAFALLEEL